MFRIPSPRRAAVVGVLGMALLAAACGGNDAGSTGNQSAAPPTTAASMTASGPFGAACSAVPASGAGSLEALAQDPVATAASNTPELSTLVTAVTKANLVDTLNSAEGITVFAPTNDAFAAVPKATLDKALGDPKGLLTTVLTYHVVPGQLALTSSPAATRPCRARPWRSPEAARTSPSTATPAWSAATSRPPTPPSTSSTRSSSPRADHHTTQPRRGHRHHHASGRAVRSLPRAVSAGGDKNVVLGHGAPQLLSAQQPALLSLQRGRTMVGITVRTRPGCFA